MQPTFGELLRAHRIAARMTQEQLAERSGLSARTVSNLERGLARAPRLPSLALLATALSLVGAERDRFERSGREAYWQARRSEQAGGGEQTGQGEQAAADGAKVGRREGAGGAPSGPGGAAGRAPVPPSARPVPAQLPADVPAFTGRQAELAQLDSLVAGPGTAAESGAAGRRKPTAVVISAVSGTAGVGKTALAVHWAHRVREWFPDGQLYVDLRGFDPSGRVVAADDAVRGFLDALGVPAEQQPSGQDARVGLYRSLVAGQRMLVVLDNARDAEQVRPLLPGTPTTFVVATSRYQLTGLVAVDGARPLPLDLLTDAEARQLLARRLGGRRVAAEPQAADGIVTRCARLPLALTIAAARAATNPGFPLATLDRELAQAGGRLDALAAGEPASEVRTVFSWSYRALTPAAATLFRLLGLHPGPDVSAPAAAALAGRPPGQLRPLLTELVRASLLTEPVPGRYACHDLLRAYAADLSRTVDPEHVRRAATGRVLDYYVHTACAAARLLYPTRDPSPLPLTPPAPEVDAEVLADPPAALAWLAAEHPVLLAAVGQAAEAGFDTHTWQLAWAVDTFLDRRGRWHSAADAWRAAVAAAGRLGDLRAQAHAHRYLAWAHTRLGRYEDAHAHLLRALDLSDQAGDRAGQADAHHNLAHLWERRDRPRLALDHAEQALALSRDGGDLRGQAYALNAVGWHHALVGEHTPALSYCTQALPLFQRVGDRRGEAATWDSLGYAHHHLGHHWQAAGCYRKALGHYRDLGDRYDEATTLVHLGDTQHAADNPAAARAAWQDALDILTGLDHPDADRIRGRLDNPACRPDSG